MPSDYAVKPYCTVEELRDAITYSGTDKDDEILRLIRAASKTIDNVCKRPDGFVADSTASSRLFGGRGIPYVEIDECVEITGVSTKTSPTDSAFVAWDAGTWIAFRGSWRKPNYNVLPYNAIMGTGARYGTIFQSSGYTSVRGFSPDIDNLSSRIQRTDPMVQVTARWGYQNEIPEPIKEACVIQASRWFKRGEGAYADSLGNAEFGDVRYAKAMDHDVKLILMNSGYIKPL